MIDQRNACCSEFNKNLNSINERKNKKLLEDKSTWDLDLSLILKYKLDVEIIKSDPDLAKCFMFTEESLKLRNFADIVGFCNHATYKEVIYFEEYFVRQILAQFEEFSESSIRAITKNHEHWAEMVYNLSDMKGSYLPAIAT